MAGSLSTTGRPDGVSAQCFSDFPRRLALIGGFVLLGWFALAIAGATHAAAAPDPSAGASEHRSVAASNQLPTIDSLQHGSPAAGPAHAGSLAGDASRTAGAVRRAARPAASTPTVPSSTPASRTDGYGAAVVPLPSDDPATSSSRGDAHPTRAGPSSSVPLVDENAVLNELPVVDGLAPSIEQAVDPALKPIESAAAPVLAPASELLAPVGRVVTQLGTAVHPESASLDGLLAPVTTLVDDAVAQVAQPVSTLTASLAPAVSPLAGALREVTTSALAPPQPAPGPPVVMPGPPGPVEESPVGQGETRSMPGGPASIALPSSAGGAAGVDYSAPGAEPDQPTTSAAPIAAGSSQLARDRVPAPLPTVPPSAPELLVIAAAPAGATTSNPGSGGTPLPGLSTGESWAAQQLHRVGIVDSGRSRAVRNSATKPPVSPD